MCGITATVVLLVASCLVLYGLHVNRLMKQTPPEALAYLDPPLTPDHARLIYRRVKENGIDWNANLPPAKDRRYLIVGGSGLVGGQIAACLQATGVPPQAIRIVDLLPPAQAELASSAGTEVAWFKADITSQQSVDAAFSEPWPATVLGLPLTVFHTAAVIRPFERDPVFYPRCARVNVLGSAHVLAAARRAGAGVLIFTSSCNAGASGRGRLLAAAAAGAAVPHYVCRVQGRGGEDAVRGGQRRDADGGDPAGQRRIREPARSHHQLYAGVAGAADVCRAVGSELGKRAQRGAGASAARGGAAGRASGPGGGTAVYGSRRWAAASVSGRIHDARGDELDILPRELPATGADAAGGVRHRGLLSTIGEGWTAAKAAGGAGRFVADAAAGNHVVVRDEPY
ncbi:hypothetical protein XA68_15851 [Ophiocordyceps unilateralis]|uniref:3-beta hydroxysteroid dehydrogenase/isomerase domain-containing protein n=1 Tax=Ophiocordyceps unilateralis TaxID=268505 RepID=A0A2A9P7P6_OPHUN|nr:hypothetical protein XA68_15851 [Ophiocordyceps unilateralis]